MEKEMVNTLNEKNRQPKKKDGVPGISIGSRKFSIVFFDPARIKIAKSIINRIKSRIVI